MNIYLVKAKVTRTEYIAVKAADEPAAEYIAEGVALGIIDASDKQNEDFVQMMGYTEHESHDGIAVDSCDTDDMDEALCYFDELFDEGASDFDDEENREEQKESISD